MELAMLTTAVATILYNLIAPFVLEKGKWLEWFPFMDPSKPTLNNVTSFLAAFLGSVGITWAVDLHAHTVTLAWPDGDHALKALIGAVVGYLLQKFAYKRARSAGAL